MLCHAVLGHAPTAHAKFQVACLVQGRRQGTRHARHKRDTKHSKAHAADIGTRQLSHGAENRADEKILLRMLNVNAEKRGLLAMQVLDAPE